MYRFRRMSRPSPTSGHASSARQARLSAAIFSSGACSRPSCSKSPISRPARFGPLGQPEGSQARQGLIKAIQIPKRRDHCVADGTHYALLRAKPRRVPFGWQASKDDLYPWRVCSIVLLDDEPDNIGK